MNIVYSRKILAIELKQVTAILLLSLVLQFTVHLIPYYNGIPLGARLLVMFYAPFIAVSLFRPQVGIICAFFTPALNWFLTGQPRQEIIFILTVELVIFTVISYLINRKFSDFWLTAPISYLACIAICPLQPNSIAVCLPGIGMLFLLNLSLIKFHHK